MQRGRSEEAKAVRNRLVSVTSLLPRAMVTSRPGMLLRAVSVVLPQSGSVLTSVANVPTKGHIDAWGLGLGHHLRPC